MSSIFKKQTFSSSINPADFASKGLPRIADFVLAAFGLLLLSPILGFCAMLVFSSSSGGIFFCQKRVGLGGAVFTLYKFRTMKVSKNGSLITAANDYRVTPIGRILRKWKLDELPEIFNVLIGDMSFVGPRPEVPELVDLSNPAWSIVLSVRPGITDTVTLRLRNEEAVLAKVEDKETFYREVIQPYKLQGYLDYLQIKSVKTDVTIIFDTIKAILYPDSVKPPVLEKISSYR
jgi:lipopolysaccharide/colanic/teichoic acid biosynthesis glycosyltransferase